MNRRQFISTLVIGGIAGCTSSESAPDSEDQSYDTTTQPTSTRTTTSSHVTDLDRIPVGASYVRNDSVSVELLNVQLSKRLEFSADETLRSEEGTVYMVVTVRSENTGYGLKPLPKFEAFRLHLGEDSVQSLRASSPIFPTFDLIYPSSIEAYAGGRSVSAGRADEGYLLYKIPAEMSEFRLSLTPDEDDVERVTWADSIEQNTVSQLQVKSLRVPDTETNGRSLSYSVTVENTGSVTGKLDRRVHVESSSARTNSAQTLDASIPPESTVTIDRTLPVPAREEVTLSVGAETRRVTVVPATRAYGTQFELPSGVHVRVDEPIITDRVVLGREGPGVKHSHESHRCTTHEVTARNPGRARQREPDVGWFEVGVDEFIDDYANQTYHFARMREPLEGMFYYGSKDQPLHSGDAISGPLFYDVPKGTSAEDVVFRCRVPLEEGGEQVCEWRQESSAVSS